MANVIAHIFKRLAPECISTYESFVLATLLSLFDGKCVCDIIANLSIYLALRLATVSNITSNN